MRHFHRTHIAPAAVLQLADAFFAKLGLERSDDDRRVLAVLAFLRA